MAALLDTPTASVAHRKIIPFTKTSPPAPIAHIGAHHASMLTHLHQHLCEHGWRASPLKLAERRAVTHFVARELDHIGSDARSNCPDFGLGTTAAMMVANAAARFDLGGGVDFVDQGDADFKAALLVIAHHIAAILHLGRAMREEAEALRTGRFTPTGNPTAKRPG